VSFAAGTGLTSGTVGFTSWGSYGYTTYLGGYTTAVSTSTYPTAPTGTLTGPIVLGTPTTVVPADAISTVTGIDPAEVAAATYGKIIPIWVGGMPRLGCHIIFGPTFTTVAGIVYASFGVSFGMPAVNIGVREIRELRLDGYKVWSLAEGYLMTGLTFRFYPGDELQAPDPLVTAAYPSAPVAHKGHACVFIELLALTDFNLKVPFVSAVIAETYAWDVDGDGIVTLDPVDPEDGVNLGYALEALAYSPYVNLAADGYHYGYRPAADFITEGISERVDALIVAEKVSFLDLLGRFARLHLWNIVQRDKLMAIERGSVAPDIDLDLSNIVSSSDTPPILIERAPVSDMPRELEYSFIDIARDYEINSYTARQMSVPAPSTRSEGKDTVALPVVHTIQEAASWVTLRLFKDDLARETLSFTTSIVGYEIEPGDIVRVDAGFKVYIVRVIESLKGANWTNRIRAEPVLRCAPALTYEPIPGEPPDLVLWLKGDTLTGTDGSNISTWLDSSGNNHDAVQATEADQPNLETQELNFLNVVHFDGPNSEYLGIDDDLSVLGITAGSLFIVLKSANDPGLFGQQGACFFGGAAAGNQYPSHLGDIACGDLRTSSQNIGNPSVALTDWNITEVTSESGDWNYYINGTLFFNNPSNAFGLPGGADNARVGAGGGTANWSGWIAEVILYSEVLSEADRQRVEGYLAWKWGLASVLPIGHPYKLTPPPPIPS
jgi:Putative phage tail protein